MDQVQDATDQARQKVQEAGGQVKGRARQQIDMRSSEAGEKASAAAGDARSVGEELRRQGKDKPAELAEQVAAHAERFGSYLQGANSDRLLSDAEDFGRNRPWAVMAGGVALGFIASRFLKASSRDRYQASRDVVPGGDGKSHELAGPALPAELPAQNG